MADVVSSVMIPPGYEVQLFRGNEDWEGESLTLLGKLRDDGEGIQCHNLGPLGYKDLVASLRIMHEAHEEDKEEDAASFDSFLQ